MDDLNSQYAILMAQYEDQVQQAIDSGNIAPHLDKLKSLNQQLHGITDQMIQITTQAKDTGGHMTTYRDELFQRLDRIQKDYNGMTQSTDQLETLRRIRNQQNSGFRQNFQLYLGLFLILSLLLFVVVFFKNYMSEMTASIPSIPASTPPLI